MQLILWMHLSGLPSPALLQRRKSSWSLIPSVVSLTFSLSSKLPQIYVMKVGLAVSLPCQISGGRCLVLSWNGSVQQQGTGKAPPGRASSERTPWQVLHSSRTDFSHLSGLSKDSSFFWPQCLEGIRASDRLQVTGMKCLSSAKRSVVHPHPDHSACSRTRVCDWIWDSVPPGPFSPQQTGISSWAFDDVPLTP